MPQSGQTDATLRRLPARPTKTYLGAGLTVAAVVAIAIALLLGTSDGGHVAVSRTLAATATGTGTDVATSGSSTPARVAPPSTVRLTAQRHLRILYVGDSLRGGVYASVHDKGYVSLVNAAIERKGHTVTELDATKIGKTPGKSRGANDILAVQGDADLAVLEIGTNDVNHLSVGRFALAYRKLVSMVRRTSPGTQLMCLGVWSLPNGPEVSLAPYNAAISRECRGGVYFSLTDIFRNPGFHGPEGRQTWDGTGDAFHPNDQGYRAIAIRALSHISD